MISLTNLSLDQVELPFVLNIGPDKLTVQLRLGDIFSTSRRGRDASVLSEVKVGWG